MNQIPALKGRGLEWFDLTLAVTWIQLAITIVCMLNRPCMITMSIMTLALYVLHFPAVVTRKTFRYFVAILAFSWVYDFLWLFILSSSASDEDLEDGGSEYKLRRLTKFVSWISLLFKIIVVAVFWKASIDFRLIIRGKKSVADDDINLVIAHYAQD